MDGFDVEFRAPKDCVVIDGEVLVGGLTSADLGFRETVGLFFSPDRGMVIVRASCGCRVEAPIAALLHDLAGRVSRAHPAVPRVARPH